MKPRQTFDGVTSVGIDAVAVLFGCEAEHQRYSLPNDDQGVWAVNYRAETGNIRMVFWPAINRVDVAVGPHMWVVKGIREVEVIDNLEVIARFGQDGVLTVALNGQVVLTTTSPPPGMVLRSSAGGICEPSSP